MRLIYICGPFRAPTAWQVEQHVRRAEVLALAVWKLGAVAVCPHTMSRHFHGEMEDWHWLQGDLELLARCDALITVGNWEESVGALGEVAYARDQDIPVFHALDTLAEWLTQQPLYRQMVPMVLTTAAGRQPFPMETAQEKKARP